MSFTSSKVSRSRRTTAAAVAVTAVAVSAAAQVPANATSRNRVARASSPFAAANSQPLLSRSPSNSQWKAAFAIWRAQQNAVIKVNAPNGKGGAYVSDDGSIFPWGNAGAYLTAGNHLGATIVGTPDLGDLSAAQQAGGMSRAVHRKVVDIAEEPQGGWLGYWVLAQPQVISQDAAAAHSRGERPMFVMYGIDDSENPANSGTSYHDWASQVMGLIAKYAPDAVIIAEPDALPFAASGSLSPDVAASRIAKVKDLAGIAERLKLRTYLDAGGSTWLTSAQAAQVLEKAGVNKVAGWSEDVSGYAPTQANIAYGQQIRGRILSDTGVAESFVIDSSRNGAAIPSRDVGAPFNLKAAALGSSPNLAFQAVGLDATLWVKPPSQSDLATNSSSYPDSVSCPDAGQVCVPMAKSLVVNDKKGPLPMGRFSADARSLLLVWPDGGMRMYGHQVGKFDLSRPKHLFAGARVSKVVLHKSHKGEIASFDVTYKHGRKVATYEFAPDHAPKHVATPSVSLDAAIEPAPGLERTLGLAPTPTFDRAMAQSGLTL